MAKPDADPSYYGLLLIDKAAGFSSFSVISRLRRLLGIRRIGHIGTLDPFATGLLPVCIGRATGAVSMMEHYDKRYLLTVRLGEQRDSGDTEGEITGVNEPDEERCQALLAEDYKEIRAAAASLLAMTSQVPPMHSAVKINGQRLYKLARAGKTVDRPARPIRVYDVNLVSVTKTDSWPLVTLDIRCSKGTYLRELATAFGRKLDLFAHAKALRRTEVGPFSVSDGLTIDELFALTAEHDPEWLRNHLAKSGRLLGLEQAFLDAVPIVLDREGVRQISHGKIPATFKMGGKVVANNDSILEIVGGDTGRLWSFLYNNRVTALAAYDAENGALKLKRVFISHEDLHESK